ncbi:hypothetical protein [Streptomyces sp. NPDC056291]|uniref:hypothetical protein n=1 Tax=Streptomyces sp. NPDC056291 TaxID=3345772 RepID=UPI0035DEEDE8
MPEVPISIASVTLTGRFIRPDGTPLTGNLVFEPPAHLTMSDADIISTGSATAELDTYGSFSVSLIATDAPGMQPSDWAYTVTERLHQAAGRTYHVKLPVATPIVDLADIAPTDPAKGDYIVVTGPPGTPGSTWYHSSAATPDYGDVVKPVTGDMFMYPASGDLFRYSGTAWGYVGSAKGQKGDPGGVTSVNGKTGVATLTASDVQAEPAGSVATHASASDPHGDRSWATGLFMPKAGGTLTGGLTSDLLVRAAFLKTTSTSEHAVTIYQAGTSGAGVALNVVSAKPTDSAMYLSGVETARGTLKIAHGNGGASATADASAAAISVDLQWNGKAGTAAQGIYLTATEGPTTGRLVTLRNSDPTTTDDFAVAADGKTGIRIPVGNAPAAALEVRQRDTSTVGVLVVGADSTTQPIFQVKNSGGTATLEVGTSGAIVTRAVTFMSSALQLGATSLDVGGSGGAVISMKNATTAPTTNPSGGVIMYGQGSYFKVRAGDGTIFDTTKRTVTGAKGSNAALASLLTALANAGLITDSTSA